MKNYLAIANSTVRSLRPTPVTAACALALAALLPAAAGAFGGQISAKGPQLLISGASAEKQANAPASEPVISHDNRIAKAVAFTSAATDITTTATGGFSNVYLTIRKTPYGKNANEAWKIGSTVLASRANAVPNGDSFAPALSGDDNHAAKCLAFVSAASNLVSGDNNGQADLFVRPLGKASFKRTATKGAATDVAVDGKCKTLAYTTNKGVFVKKIGGKTRKIASGNATDVNISVYGTDVSFAKGSAIFAWRGKGVKKVGVGSNPSLSGSGKVVAFDRGGTVYKRDLRSGGKKKVSRGSEPSLTLVGTFAYFVHALKIDETNLKQKIATCPVAPTAPETSAHGNYVVYLCDRSGANPPNPQVYLSYVAGK